MKRRVKGIMVKSVESVGMVLLNPGINTSVGMSSCQSTKYTEGDSIEQKCESL